MTARTINTTRIAHVDPGSCAERAGLKPDDLVREVNGVVPRDVLEWARLSAESSVHLVIERNGTSSELVLEPKVGEALGISLESAVFDRVNTCDNHCEFCFIYQLPKGMRRSLYLKDDDYRLSFLFGNFTTLTRFTEADLERVIDERLSPIYVSIHATDVHTRTEMLRNERGGTSLRWLRLLLEAGIEVRAQIVLCPGVNDGEILDSTLAGMLEQFPTIESIAVVPVGLSKHNTEQRMRVHTPEEARKAIDQAEMWGVRFREVLGRNPLHLSDEFYMVAGVQVPAADTYGDYPMLEDGVGLVRSFVEAFNGRDEDRPGKTSGFFASVDGASPCDYVRAPNPAAETGLRSVPTPVSLSPRRHGSTKGQKRVVIVTGTYAAPVMRSLLDDNGFNDVAVCAVTNEHFGGNTAVAGLLTFSDVSRSLALEPGDCHFLLPDVCLNDGRFLDGHTIDELRDTFDVEVVPTSGASLRRVLDKRIGSQ